MLRSDPPSQRRYREAGSRLDRLGRLPQGNGACTRAPGSDVGEIRYGVPAGILASTFSASAHQPLAGSRLRWLQLLYAAAFTLRVEASV